MRVPVPSDPLLTAAEVAPLLGGVHPRTVQRLAARGELTHVRVGRLMLFPRSAVEAYLAGATVAAR